MLLIPGTRLGAIEIVRPLGAGGMGEVYRARDKKLDRDVAIKVLPHTVAVDPDTLGRVTLLLDFSVVRSFDRPCGAADRPAP